MNELRLLFLKERVILLEDVELIKVDFFFTLAL